MYSLDCEGEICIILGENVFIALFRLTQRNTRQITDICLTWTDILTFKPLTNKGNQQPATQSDDWQYYSCHTERLHVDCMLDWGLYIRFPDKDICYFIVGSP